MVMVVRLTSVDAVSMSQGVLTRRVRDSCGVQEGWGRGHDVAAVRVVGKGGMQGLG